MVSELGFIGFVLAQYWVLYALFIRILAAILGVDRRRAPNTGSTLSRSIIPGTVIRMLFFDIPVILLGRAVFWFFSWQLPQGAWAAPALVGQFVGLALSDAITLTVKRGDNERVSGRPTRVNTGRPKPADNGRNRPRDR